MARVSGSGDGRFSGEYCDDDGYSDEENDTDIVNNKKLDAKKSDFTFDNVVGHLEDMLIDDNFFKLQNGFLEKYWTQFEESEENKHVYMTIFNEYTNEIENFISLYLTERIINFDMNTFATELEKRKGHLDGEVFEVLLTLSDFKAFKEIFIDYRLMKEGKTIDLSRSFNISSVPL